MNIALYGGTFDPVHLGHVAVAHAAAERFNFGRVYFVPADIPPHKQKQPLTAYYHRYAMLALALAGEKKLLPSLLEAPEIVQAEGQLASYSVDTVRRFRQRLGKRDKLFFLIGIDAFQDIGKWKDPVALLRECEFVVASRPGFSLAEAAMSLPEEIRPKQDITRLFRQREAAGPLVLSGAVIHFLEGIYKPESSTQVRDAVRAASRSGTPGLRAGGGLYPQDAFVQGTGEASLGARGYRRTTRIMRRRRARGEELLGRNDVGELNIHGLSA